MTPEIEISQATLNSLPNCLLVDMRDAESVAYGVIPGAVPLPPERLEAEVPARCAGRPVVLYCARGQFSVDAAEDLRRLGVEAYSLEGGYAGWLLYRMQREQETSLQQQIEEGIRKTWHKRLFSKFAKAIRTYDLVRPGDRIAVCISGGKDSMLMAKLLQLLQRHSDVPFEVVDLVMDPGYNAVNRQKIESNAALLHIPVTIFETNIFDVTSGIEQSPCYLCARMRRGYLYSKARELGCNKIALGHHFSDVVETTVMGMFYGSQLQAMPPKLRSRNFPGMELIRPMYCIHEDDIIAWQRYNGLEFIQCACRFTERAAAHGNDGSSSKRQEVKLLLRELRRTNPDIEKSIFHSIHSVCLDTMVGYKSGGVEHTFADCYRERGEMAEMEKEDAE